MGSLQDTQKDSGSSQGLSVALKSTSVMELLPQLVEWMTLRGKNSQPINQLTWGELSEFLTWRETHKVGTAIHDGVASTKTKPKQTSYQRRIADGDRVTFNYHYGKLVWEEEVPTTHGSLWLTARPLTPDEVKEYESIRRSNPN